MNNPNTNWIESTLQTMTLEQKVGHLLMPWVREMDSAYIEGVQADGPLILELLATPKIYSFFVTDAAGTRHSWHGRHLPALDRCRRWFHGRLFRPLRGGPTKR